MKDLSNQICIIVPCYNVQQVMRRCIDSLLNQDVKVSVLIVNDGSTDETEKIALEYAGFYDNVRVISKKNEGLPQARRTGVLNVDCKYIGFVDADDWVDPSMYQQLYKGAEESSAEIASCNMLICDEKGQGTYLFKRQKKEIVLSALGGLHEIHLRRGIGASMCNKLFQREVLLKGCFPKGNFIGEDYETFTTTMMNCKRLYYTDKALYFYFQAVGSMSKSGFSKGHMVSFAHYRNLEKQFSSEKWYADVVRYVSVEYMSFIIAMDRNKVYDPHLVEFIKKYIRRNLGVIMISGLGMKYKIAAALCAVSEKILSAVYQLIR